MSIHPAKLRHLMTSKGFNNTTLAAESGVSAKTISRALKGEDTGANTGTRLAKALGVTPEELALPPASDEQDPNAYFYRHAFTLSGSERLNFDLVSHRYGVPQADILKAAPALFALVAEMSLAKRRADLEVARAALPPVPAHLKNAATVATYRLENVLYAEDASISRADIFGRDLYKALSEDFDIEPAHRDPFHTFFRDAAEAANADAFSHPLDPNDLPHRIFPADLDTLTGNDRAAALALERGRVRIQAIPADLLAQDRSADRIAWLASHLTEEDRAWLGALDDITLDDLNLGEEPPHGH